MPTIRRSRIAWTSTLALAALFMADASLSAKPRKDAPVGIHAGKGKDGKGKNAKAARALPTPRPAAGAEKVARREAPKHAPMPRARPTGRSHPAQPPHQTVASAIPMLIGSAEAAVPSDLPEQGQAALAYAPATAPTAADLDTLRSALTLARQGKIGAAGERKADIRDLVGQKLVEWVILRSADDWLPFRRYAAFIDANPSWPSLELLRRRAEGQLWHEKADPRTVLDFFSRHEALSAKGRLSLARALLANGRQAEAQRLIRETWRDDALSDDLEDAILEQFGSLLSRADHLVRLNRRLYADDFGAAARAAHRLGGHFPEIVKAAVAVEKRAKNAGSLLESVSVEARQDPAYMFSRIRWLRRNDHIGEAAQLMLAVPRDANAAQDADEWWIERRILVRALLDADNPQAAYRIANEAVAPAKPTYRIDQLFTAGWIALRFLNDPNTALRHFNAMAKNTDNRTALGRAGYWLGRAAEAAGRTDEARRHYETGARYGMTYYGQLARARLGLESVGLRKPPALSESQRLSIRQTELVRGLEMLYAAGQSELAIPFVYDAADRLGDPAVLTVMAEIARRHKDARAMLLIGKGAIANGFALDHYAFPDIGIPKFASIGPAVEQSLVYAIARQESAFNQDVVSPAKAMGLMQVTPAAGRYIARKFNVTYDEKKLRHDPAYNTQMGAAEIADLVSDYGGNHLLAFAAYNAGRGRVKQWIERFGDPRDPAIDPVDWVERIPFSETRNYVQRVMENLQVYRARFRQGARLTIEADLRGARGN
ncbi:MAG TPA: lytic transglycosylase domain-containing protein [Xanthobacteraceae bacterium]|nr:lytic transglycosylase domain-containing protein [Xanthobacteraceae bacterium]